MRLAALIPTLLCASSAVAWPSGWNPFDSAQKGGLELRQRLDMRADRADRSSTTTQQPSSSPPPREHKKTITKASSSASPSSTPREKHTVTTAQSQQLTTTTTHTTSKYETTKTFNDILPAGGVSMITPAPIAGPQYYKIGNPSVTEYVTFAWNYTSLSVTPSAVDILASCALNSQTYTIALNQTITAATQTVLWDTGEYERTASVPLAVATYTLIIYDADSSPNAVARSGYLAAFNQLTFGMYSPKPAVAMDAIVCATCSGASALERQTMMFLGGMVVLTVLSAGWFAGVAGWW